MLSLWELGLSTRGYAETEKSESLGFELRSSRVLFGHVRDMLGYDWASNLAPLVATASHHAR